MVLPLQNPPPIPPAPPNLIDQGMKSVKQAEGVSGFFGANQTSLITGGMGPCSCVALYYLPPVGPAFGALIHYDSGSVLLNGSGNKLPTVDAVFDLAIANAGLNKQTLQQTCLVFLAFSEEGWSNTAGAALNELTTGNYVPVQQFRHKGSAALDATGAFFDPYQDAPGQLQGAPARRRTRDCQCMIL